MRRVLPLVLLAGLSGCAVGPDHERPDASTLVPEHWSEERDNSASDEIVRWWRELGDDELTELIERAFVTNLTLAEARERVIEARARRGIANADRLPTLDAEASYSRTQTGDEASALGAAPPGTEADVYSLGAVAGWELDLWGRVGRLVEAADAEIEFAIEDFRAARVALAAELAREVVLVRAIDRDIRLVESTIQADRDAVDIARARASAGFGDELDAARAQRDLESNLALLPSLRADRREAEFRIAVLLGDAPGEIRLSEADLPRRDVVPSLGVPADLLLRRPDLRRAERELAAATARIGAAEADRLPRVTLSGSIALQGPDIGDAFNPEAYVLQAGPAISLPLFQGGRIRSGILQAESRQRQALLRLQASALDALSEVEIASMRRVRSEERVASLSSAEAAARTAEDLSTDLYTAGQVDFLDVTESRRSRLSIERSRVEAERDALLRLVDLYAALGGGWEPGGESLAASDPPDRIARTRAEPDEVRGPIDPTQRRH
ncbi:MAG: efflux transporter outer membrane subunit [Planctomycetota bacterium]